MSRISRLRKQELMCSALAYAGQLVRQAVNSYSAFEELPAHERDFIDEYIVSIGDRLTTQAEQRRPANKTAARQILRQMDSKKESA